MIRKYSLLVRQHDAAVRQCLALVVHKMDINFEKGGGQKKKFLNCLNPNYPHQSLYFRVIQGHSGSAINLALQDNVLLPEGYTEFFITSETEKT